MVSQLPVRLGEMKSTKKDSPGFILHGCSLPVRRSQPWSPWALVQALSSIVAGLSMLHHCLLAVLSPAHSLVVCDSLNFLLPLLSEPSLFCSDNYWYSASLIILRVKILGWLPSLLAAIRKLIVNSQSTLASAVAGTVLPTKEENLELRFLTPWMFTTLPLIQRKVDSMFSAFPIPYKVEGSQFRSEAQVYCVRYYWGEWKIWLKTQHSKN